MPEEVMSGLRSLVQIFEIIGGFLLILGFVIATVRCALRVNRLGGTQALEGYRQAIGRIVLIGLEVIVAATIIKTISFDPTLENLGLLAAMVAIRTGLGWSIGIELNGRWPWRRPRSDAAKPRSTS
jgi:uncharacterized membrane protein